MRAFNPEKELKKIQKGNKNKVILFVVLLLVVSAVSYSFALYQIRYSKQIIYTTVGPFNKKDIIISVKLDDQEKSTDKFPNKEDRYVYSHIECENNNIQNANWNEGTWKLNAEINGPDKCTVFFVKSPFHMKSCENKSMSECLLEEGQKFPEYLAFDDPDSNARYYGETPANYIWFNCDSYENLTNATAEDEKHNCERWRIIGSFKDITIVDDKVNTETPTKENLVKIIRADAIGGISWNKENNVDWTNASLQKILNSDYLDSDEGTYTSKSSVRAINKITINMIEEVQWNLGSVDHQDRTASYFYTSERGTTTYNSYPATWNGKIALIYPSDSGFATAGSNNGDSRSTCLTVTIFNYSKGCGDKGWIKMSKYISTLTTWGGSSIYAGNIYVVHLDGSITGHGTLGAYSIVPSLYLKTNVKITSGQGTFDEPYIIVNNL